MKIKITLKDPDGPYESIRDAAMQSLPEGLSQKEQESLVEIRHSIISKKCAQWLKYGEYITVEIDTDAQTATVLPAE